MIKSVASPLRRNTGLWKHCDRSAPRGLSLQAPQRQGSVCVLLLLPTWLSFGIAYTGRLRATVPNEWKRVDNLGEKNPLWEAKMELEMKENWRLKRDHEGTRLLQPDQAGKWESLEPAAWCSHSVTIQFNFQENNRQGVWAWESPSQAEPLRSSLKGMLLAHGQEPCPPWLSLFSSWYIDATCGSSVHRGLRVKTQILITTYDSFSSTLTGLSSLMYYNAYQMFFGFCLFTCLH